MTNVRRMVKEELARLMKESTEKAPELETKLESLRKKLIPEMTNYDMGSIIKHAKQKKIQIQTVSEILNVKVNELVLYFLNNVKTRNEESLIEYHAGTIFFFSDEDH